MLRSIKLFSSRAYSILTLAQRSELESFSKIEIATALGLDSSYIERAETTTVGHPAKPHRLEYRIVFKGRGDEEMVRDAMNQIKKVTCMLKRHEITCSNNCRDLYDPNILKGEFQGSYSFNPDVELSINIYVNTDFMDFVRDRNQYKTHKFQ